MAQWLLLGRETECEREWRFEWDNFCSKLFGTVWFFLHPACMLSIKALKIKKENKEEREEKKEQSISWAVVLEKPVQHSELFQSKKQARALEDSCWPHREANTQQVKSVHHVWGSLLVASATGCGENIWSCSHTTPWWKHCVVCQSGISSSSSNTV